ncbi:hypothetical protein N0V90_009450 [Kalmusia sp. IMI 367209]|nr:hypothetical protein N0V90_009450 [Kalmusia sp. IMI 367209]
MVLKGREGSKAKMATKGLKDVLVRLVKMVVTAFEALQVKASKVRKGLKDVEEALDHEASMVNPVLQVLMAETVRMGVMDEKVETDGKAETDGMGRMHDTAYED